MRSHIQPTKLLFLAMALNLYVNKMSNSAGFNANLHSHSSNNILALCAQLLLYMRIKYNI